MKTLKILLLTLLSTNLYSQEKKGQELIYQSNDYSIYNDEVKQGKNTAYIISPTNIKSNYKIENGDSKEWNLSMDISKLPSYKSDQLIVDALFNLSTEESLKNIESDSTFRTGAKWGGVWTRDISYSIILAFAYLQPEVAKISLMKKVKRERIIQDTGSGGAWPVSTDRMIWAVAAWEIYKTTGDKKWLGKIYPIIKNSLDDDWKTIYDPSTGLYRGESSFLDWREQTYPKWMSNMDIYVSENLGTNIVHYQANNVFVEISKLLNKPNAEYHDRANNLKKSIDANFWINDKGFYGQYLYGRPNLNLSPRSEALGEALSIYFDLANSEKSKSIISKSPVTPFGATCIYPQIPEIPPYHNNAIWPFVQSYWNLAAAKTGNEKALVYGLSSIYRAAALYLTNYENFVAETGDFNGTEINSDRMLWSMAGNLAMVYRVFMGISFDTSGIAFSPTIPKVFGGNKTLSNFKYRNAILDITVNGFGKKIASITMDGKLLDKAFIPASTQGKHLIVIQMDNESFDTDSINMVPNYFSLKSPDAKQIGNMIQWPTISNADYYIIYRDSKLLKKTKETKLEIDESKTATYKVTAVDKKGWESFSSEPLLITPKNNLITIEIEDFAAKSTLPYENFNGKGFVEFSSTFNKEVAIKVDVKKTGKYLLDFKYSNGSGPWNTENKCAIRSLYTNGNYTGAVIFPQRGTDLWSDWAYSNSYYVDLKKGENSIIVKFEDWNNNMNVEVNKMMLDNLRLILVN
ncbi:MAG: MGH1-like glycoside hydrolase domain-containing protein [Flavobacterium sp.]